MNVNSSETLDMFLHSFRRGNIGKKEMETIIFNHIHRHPSRYSLDTWNHEQRNDFISWLYPRISSAIDRYEDRGSSFDAYMGAMVRLSSREYYLRQKERRITEKTWWTAKAKELLACEDEPLYREAEEDFKKVTNVRQVLILLLKSYQYLSEDFLARAAPAVNLDKETLLAMVDELRKLRFQQEEEIQGLRERVYCQYYRCLAFERRMKAAAESSASRLCMEKRLKAARRRLISMRERLASMRAAATNKQIARILGIPAGTVDSNLFTVKQNHSGKENKLAGEDL